MTIKFKKVNIYDIGALILILALCAAAYIKFGIIDHTKVDTQMSNIEYSILFTGLREYSVDAFKSGDIVYDSQTKLEIGTIKEIKSEPAKVVVETVNGEAKEVVNNQRFDVTLVIDTEGLENDIGYFANRSVELKVGSAKQIETLYIKSSGIVSSIKVLEK